MIIPTLQKNKITEIIYLTQVLIYKSVKFKQIKLTVGILYEIKFDSFKQSVFFS